MTDRDYDDDYDRPRTPRVRRRSKKKSGHKWWVFPAILGVFGLIFLGCLGFIGFGLWSGGVVGSNWRTFEVPNGGCKLDMPGEPTLEPQGPGNTTVVYATEQYFPFQSFAIAYVDIPAHETDPTRAFNDGINGMLTTFPGTKEKSRTTETIAGYPARQVTAYHPSHGVMIGQLIAVEGRMFILVAISGEFSLEHPSVRRFLDSFVVTDPDPLGRKSTRERAEGVVKAEKESKETQIRTREDRERGDYIEKFETQHALGRLPPEAIPGRISYLPFDETADGTIRDLGTNTVAGTLAPPARFGVGVRVSALHLPKEDVEVVLPGFAAPAVESSKPVAIVGWFRTRAMKGNVLRLTRPQSKLAIDPSGLVLSSQYVTFLWPSKDRITSLVAPLADDKSWHHFAVIRTPRAKDEVLDFYLDGERVARSEPGTQSDLTAFHTLTLGGGGFVGAIDELAVYHRALTANEVRSLAGLPPTEPTGAGAAGDPTAIPGLVFHLPLDEAGGSVYESVSGKPVGKVLGRVEETDGVRGKAVRFLNPTSGGQAQLMLNLDDQKEKFRFAKGKAFSIALWARLTSGTAIILGGDLALLAFPAQSSGFDQLHLTAPIAGFNRPLVTARRPPGDKWAHVAITGDASGEVQLYVNGEPMGKPDRPRLDAGIAPLRAGLLHGGWPCDLDDFCVFDRALSEAEVKKLAGRR